MGIIKMKNYAVVILFLLSGCASIERNFFSDDLVNIAYGTSKDDVMKVIKEPHRLVSSSNTDEGLVEVYEYVEKPLWVGRANEDYWTSWYITFVNGQFTDAKLARDINDHKKEIQAMEWAAAANMIQANTSQSANGSYYSEYAWDAFYNNENILIWQCRDKITGRFVRNNLCYDKYKIDDTWTGK
jgi:hypothetical protein